MEKETLKTGTTTVGLVCKDGIVLAADRRATAGNLIMSKKTEKIVKITDNMAITTAGSVSEIQLLIKVIKAELKIKQLRTYRDVTMKEAANFIAGIVYNSIRQFSAVPSIAHFLLGGTDNGKFHLYDIFPDGSLEEPDDFVCSGSGSFFAYGILDSMYKKNMSIKEGTELAVRAVNAALQRDSASGDGIMVMAITKDGCKKVMEKELVAQL